MIDVLPGAPVVPRQRDGGPRHLVLRPEPPTARSWWVLLLATTALAVVVAFLPKPVARWVTAAAGVLTLGAMASGVARDWERWGWATVRRHPLTLLGLSLAFTVAGEVLHAAGAAFPSRTDGVALVAYPLVLVGLLRLTRTRLRERPVDTLLLAAIVPVTALVFGWLPLRAALQRWVAGADGGDWRPVAFLAVDALAIAITARLALLFRGRPIGHWMLLGSFAATLGAHTARAAAALTHAVPAPVGSQSLLLLGFGLLGTAALHPSLGVGAALHTRPPGLGRLHVQLLAAAVALGPLIVIVRYEDQGRWVLFAVGGPAAVSLLVVAHLWRIVQERGRLEHLSLHDPLTGLPNRVCFRERLEQAVESADRGTTFAVGLIDLDRFKKINDSLGHAAGDELLTQVAARLRAASRGGDTVARLSGDEFAFLLQGVDEAQVREVSARLHSSFSERFRVAGRDLFISPSIGVALFPAHGVDPDTLLRNADLAMYEVKSLGRDAVEVYHERLGAHAHQDLALETALHRALERDELVLHYQPKLRLDTGALVGVEALVRWDHPHFGLIPPGAFVHFAEESGLIAPIGEWVLRAACRQAASWMAEGHRIPVSVNLSARQFQLQRLSELVASALEDSGLPSDLLELELTESLSLDEQDSVLSTLADLRELGVRCSIDDFGTGYSGLAYLSRYPIDALKLDRSFVAGISGGDAPIVRAIIAMAHSLGLEVIAEGVETTDQAAFLRAQGCDVLQGYLASRPVAAAAVVEGAWEWIELAARAWAERPSAVLDYDQVGVELPLPWSRQVLGEMLATLEPRTLPASEDAGMAEAEEPVRDRHVQRTLVLTSASAMLTLPVFLGLGAANALPPSVQARVAAGLTTLGATGPGAQTPEPHAKGRGHQDGRGSSAAEPGPSSTTPTTGGAAGQGRAAGPGPGTSAAPPSQSGGGKPGAGKPGAGKPDGGKPDGGKPGKGKGRVPGAAKGPAVKPPHPARSAKAHVTAPAAPSGSSRKSGTPSVAPVTPPTKGSIKSGGTQAAPKASPMPSPGAAASGSPQPSPAPAPSASLGA